MSLRGLKDAHGPSGWRALPIGLAGDADGLVLAYWFHMRGFSSGWGSPSACWWRRYRSAAAFVLLFKQSAAHQTSTRRSRPDPIKRPCRARAPSCPPAIEARYRMQPHPAFRPILGQFSAFFPVGQSWPACQGAQVSCTGEGGFGTDMSRSPIFPPPARACRCRNPDRGPAHPFHHTMVFCRSTSAAAPACQSGGWSRTICPSRRRWRHRGRCDRDRLADGAQAWAKVSSECCGGTKATSKCSSATLR